MAKRSKILCSACAAENNSGEKICQRCGSSLAAIDTDIRECTIICPRCQSTNNAAGFFCYTCGKYFADVEEAKAGWGSAKKKRGAVSNTAPKAKVIMPAGTEITLTGAPVFIERSDFDSTMPYDLLMSF